jgi:hypothetical protein
MAKYTFDLNKLTVADYLAMASISKLPQFEQVQTTIFLAQKACDQNIDIYAEPFVDAETVIIDFGACLEAYWNAKQVPPTFWKWGQQDES